METPSKDVRIATADFAAAAATKAQVPPPTHPEIAFAGRSNVGKSSLLNMLLARKSLARTSSTPGRTRQIVFFDIAIAGGGPKLSFADLPGYGYAKVSKAESLSWKDLLESYLQKRETLRAVILLVDVRRGLEKEEEDLLEFLALRKDVAVVIAATKIDKLGRSVQKSTVAKLAKAAGVKVVGTSAETKQGRDELWSRIFGAVM